MQNKETSAEKTAAPVYLVVAAINNLLLLATAGSAYLLGLVVTAVASALMSPDGSAVLFSKSYCSTIGCGAII